MLSYLYVEQLFRNILTHSTVMQGRFYLCPHYGSEMNEINVGDILARTGLDKKEKYPLCIMLPPVSRPLYGRAQKDYYRADLLFLTKTYAASNGMVKQPAGDGKSSHTIPMDWHDMKRCADDFTKVLIELVQNTNLRQFFFLNEKENPITEPVSTIGDDRVSGVVHSISFAITAAACAIEDYPVDFLTHITIPTTDIHPTHLH